MAGNCNSPNKKPYKPYNKSGNKSKETVRAAAPYNFVPFSDKILIPDEPIPGQDRISDDLKSGEIHITVTAETPLLVAEGKSSDSKDDNPPKNFFRDAEGRYAIPGSSVRGMIRENMQILGFGHIRAGEDLDDKEIFYRKIFRSEGSKYNDHIGKKGVSDPENVRAGYIENINGRYYLWRVTGGTYLKVESHITGSIEDHCPGKKHYITDIWYLPETDDADIQVSFTAKPGMKHGRILFNTKLRKTDNNYYYIFPDPAQNQEPIAVPQADILAYNQDLEDRKNVVDGKFFALPGKRGIEPFFYIRLNGHYYFSRSLYPRIPYDYSLKDGIPESHKELARQSEVTLDMPHRILGYAAAQQALKSRVSFENLVLTEEAPYTVQQAIATGEPKPSFYWAYSIGGKDYNDQYFELAGFKQYWLKDPDDQEIRLPSNQKLISNLNPLEAGTAFTGVIHYENLREEELGLLLWALRLDEGCRQQLGMAKEFGYGRVRLTIDQLREHRAASMYSPAGAFQAAQATDKDTIKRYIQAYQAYADEKLGLNIAETPTIRAFLYMKKTVRPNTQEVRNFALSSFAKINKPLPTVQNFMDGDPYRDQVWPVEKSSTAGRPSGQGQKPYGGRDNHGANHGTVGNNRNNPNHDGNRSNSGRDSNQGRKQNFNRGNAGNGQKQGSGQGHSGSAKKHNPNGNHSDGK